MHLLQESLMHDQIRFVSFPCRPVTERDISNLHSSRSKGGTKGVGEKKPLFSPAQTLCLKARDGN